MKVYNRDQARQNGSNMSNQKVLLRKCAVGVICCFLDNISLPFFKKRYAIPELYKCV